jgi:hypothetical protein
LTEPGSKSGARRPPEAFVARDPRRHDPAPKDRRAGTLRHCFCPHRRASRHEGGSLNLLVLRADGTRGRLSLSPFLKDFASFSDDARLRMMQDITGASSAGA